MKLSGSLVVHEVHAPSLENNLLGDPARRQTPVYLPPGYAQSSERFPVAYFLHGYMGCGLAWINTSSFAPTVVERIDRLVSSSAVPPFIGVFVDGWTSLGGSQWSNSVSVGRYRDYVARDVVSWADRELRTLARPESRAVIGKSSGGFGALLMGWQHPDVFGHIGSHSADAYFEYGYIPELPKAASALLKAGGPQPWYQEFLRRAAETKMRGEDHAVISVLAMAAVYSPKPGAPLGLELPMDLETGRILDDVWRRWLEHDPARFVPANLEAFRRLKSIFLDCGTRDEFNLRWGARIISQALEAASIEHRHEEFEDGHMGINYRYDSSVSYLVPRLSRG